MSMQFNKPKFDREAKDQLSELEQFKQECSVLFNGPLSEMKDQQKAGLVVNRIGHQCTITLHLVGITLDKPKTVFNSLESILDQTVIRLPADFNSEGLSKNSPNHVMVICQSLD